MLTQRTVQFPKIYENPILEEFFEEYYGALLGEDYKYEEFFNYIEGRKTLKDQVYLHVLRQVSMNKSPGCPGIFVSIDNMDLFHKFGGFIRDEVSDRLVAMERIGYELWMMYISGDLDFEDINLHTTLARLFVESRLCDPVMLNVKDEGRIKGKRPRLVCSVSVIHTLVTRVLLGDALLEEQEHDDLPIAVAIDLVTQAKTRERYDKFATCGDLVSNDVQGWEYALDYEYQLAAFYKQVRVMGCVDYTVEGKLNIVESKKNHFYALFTLYLMDIFRILTDSKTGVLFCSPKAGMQSSGKLATFSDNSFMRSYAEFYASRLEGREDFKPIFTAGDDCLSGFNISDETFSSLGFKITDTVVNTPESGYNFCSTLFTRDGSYVESIFKSLFQLVTRPDVIDEASVSFVQNYERHPDFDRCYSVLDSVRQDTISFHLISDFEPTWFTPTTHMKFLKSCLHSDYEFVRQ